MFSPTFLSEDDRTRLVEVNQMLLTGITSGERTILLKEQQEIMGRRRDITDCTFDELQQLRQQLFDQYQKHAAIGSSQTPLIARYIQQVELLEFEHMRKSEAAEPEVKKKTIHDKPKRPSRVSTKSSSYSWTIPSEGDD